MTRRGAKILFPLHGEMIGRKNVIFHTFSEWYVE